VAGVPLFQRTCRSLELAGCSEIVVVLGHDADTLRRHIERELETRLSVSFVVNEQYHLKNGVSVLAAAERVSDQFLLTMADHVFGDEVMHMARSHAPPVDGATLVVDYKLDSIFDMDDATKVLEKDGKIAEIGKVLPRYNCVDTGLFLCTTALLTSLRRVVEQRGDASLSEGVQALAKAGTMTVVDLGGGFWQDIDTPNMLEHAERRLLGRSGGAE
jgi:choline kinase